MSFRGRRLGIEKVEAARLAAVTIYCKIAKFGYYVSVKMDRQAAVTSPPTFTSGEVSAIFHGAISCSTLQNLDRKALFRPSYYYDAQADGGLIGPSDRDRIVVEQGPSHGDPRRRYTYTDLVWIRIFVRLRHQLESANVPLAAQKAARVVSALREKAGQACPPAWRLVFLGTDLYLVEDDSTAVSLTRPGQLGFVALLETVEAEIRGRVTALAAHRAIRPIAPGTSQSLPTEIVARRNSRTA